ncbi:MAG: hypothetical protein ACE5KL_04855 [Alphaproteobacteria bacterium]
MTRLVSSVVALTAVVFFAMACPALAAQFFVAASTAPGLTRGAIIDGDKPLSLPEGARVTLIAPDGKTVTLDGPFHGPPGGGAGTDDGELFAALSDLVSSQNASIASLGGTRGSPESVPEDPFTVALGASGSHCVPASQPMRLWRPDTKGSSLLTIRPGSGSVPALVETLWPEGTAMMPWPKDLALEAGATYLIYLVGGASLTEVVLHRVPADLPSEAHRIAWMAEHGCTRQALRLLEKLE